MPTLKVAFDITIVLVTDENAQELPSIGDLMNGLIQNKLEFYGEYVSSDTRPIIYLSEKKDAPTSH